MPPSHARARRTAHRTRIAVAHSDSRQTGTVSPASVLVLRRAAHLLVAIIAQIDANVRHGQPATWIDEAFKRFPTWMWRNREVADFAAWLRGHNDALPPAERVEFRGLDVYSLGMVGLELAVGPTQVLLHRVLN